MLTRTTKSTAKMAQHMETHRRQRAEIRPAIHAIRRPLCALLIAGQLAGCASTAEDGFSSEPEPEAESGLSALGTIAGAAGGGAIVGAAMAGEVMSGCSGDGCAYLLGAALLLIPIAAVIGAGIGLAEVAFSDDDDEDAAATNEAILSGSGCPDPRAAEWLRECRDAQGPLPAAFSPSPDRTEAVPNPEFHTWFDACGVALEQTLEARARTLVPQACRRDPIPTPDRVLCMQKSAAAEEEAQEARRLLAAQRAAFEREGHCSL
jgi:hypothetical protein